MQLRYGINPDQKAVIKWDGRRSPLRPVAGEPSYINILDALNAWQLVREADRALDAPVATSFKHVSPAGAAAAGALDEVMEATWNIASGGLSPVASAYVRARDGDPRASYGDFVAVSQPVDHSLTDFLASVVSNGIIAPGFEPGTVERLAKKAGGRFVVIEADPDFEPPDREHRELFGVRLEQKPRDGRSPAKSSGHAPRPISPMTSSMTWSWRWLPRASRSRTASPARASAWCSASERASSPASTAPALPVAKQTRGGSGGVPGCAPSRSTPRHAAKTASTGDCATSRAT